MNPTIIGLVGGARVGKNTIGGRLEVEHGFWSLAFAEPLYAGVAATFGLPEEALEPERKDVEIPELGTSVRRLLQRYGDLVRELCGRDVLIHLLEERMARTARSFGHDAFVITDVRLAEEIDWIRARGGVIWWVTRAGVAPVHPHPTERIDILDQFERRPGDVTIANDDGVQELLATVDARLQELRAREFASP